MARVHPIGSLDINMSRSYFGPMTARTTIRLEPGLLRAAKKKAAEEGRTVTSLVEEGLRSVLEARQKLRRPFRLKLVTVRGGKIQRGVSWDLPRDLAYDPPVAHEP